MFVRIPKLFAMDSTPVAAKTGVLKMQLQCEPCQKKVKKVLQKIHGVHSISINSNGGTVAISSSVDPRFLIAMLGKVGKKAELLWELPQQAQVNSPKPQVEQPFKNLQMAPPSPRRLSPLASPSNLQASGFDHVQLQELAKILGLKHMGLHKNINLVFKDHNDELCHAKNYTSQMCKGAANVEAATRSGHGHVTKNMYENCALEFEFSCGAGSSSVGNRHVEEQRMQMKPLVYYAPLPAVRYYAHPLATPPDYYGHGGLQPTTPPHAHFYYGHDDRKCILM